MSDFTLSGSLDSVVATITSTVDEKFYTESYVDGETAPITLGSITHPHYIVVVGENATIGFTIGTGTTVIGAYPFGCSGHVGDPLEADYITVTGSGDCIIMAGGNE